MGLFGFNKKDIVTADEPSKASGRLYLIDYENTSDTGLIGLSHLTKTDELVIFFGSNNNSISFNSLEMIHLAACRSTIEKCERSAKNYLDFRLVSYLGMRLGKEHFSSVVIVSNDMGYDAVVEFWTEQGVTICRQAAIDESIKAPTTNRRPDKKQKNTDKTMGKKAASDNKTSVKKSKELVEKKADKATENKSEKITDDRPEKKATKNKAVQVLEEKAEKKVEKVTEDKTEKKSSKKKIEKIADDKTEKEGSKKKAEKDKSKKSNKASSEKKKEKSENKPIITEEATNTGHNASDSSAQADTQTDTKLVVMDNMPKDKTSLKATSSTKSTKKNTLPESEKKKIRLAVKEMNLQPNQYSLMYAAFLDSNDLEGFHNSLARKMGPRGSEIYKLTKNIFSEFITIT